MGLGRYEVEEKGLNLLQFAEAMAVAAVEIEHVMAKSVEDSCKIIKASAVGAMGTYEFGWVPLKPETIARKANGDTPLVETGEMKDSIAYNCDTREGYVGTNDRKAIWHEFGTIHIPARPFIGGAALATEGEVTARFGVAVGKALKLI